MKTFSIYHFHPAMHTHILFNDLLTMQEIRLEER